MCPLASRALLPLARSVMVPRDLVGCCRAQAAAAAAQRDAMRESLNAVLTGASDS
jgi:hypothetical protein